MSWKNCFIGIRGSYVDDMIRAGTKELKLKWYQSYECFEIPSDDPLPHSFYGFNVEKGGLKSRYIKINKLSYFKNFKPLLLDACFSKFWSTIMKLAWLSPTRPDVLCEVSKMIQVTESIFEENKKRRWSKLISFLKYVLNNRASIIVPKLDISTVLVVGFSNASFDSNRDYTTQIGLIIFVTDNNDLSVPVHVKSYKTRRFV